MASEEDAALRERYKSALWYAVGKVVDEVTLDMGVNASPQFIGALTEMVWTQIENASLDLESFAKHASRKKIAADDVMLLTRRNEGLESVMRAYLDEMRSNSTDYTAPQAGSKRKASKR